MSIDPSTSGTLDFKQASKVTFIGSSSNTVIDTVTGSFGIGVDVNGPSSNLHVVGNTRLEGDINMLHTSNNAAIKLNSNVVTEFPRSKKLIKYPRVALTGSTSGGYTVSASSALTANPTYWVFDEVATTFWHSQYPYFNTSNGSYSPGQTAAGTGTPSAGSTLPTTELVSGHQGEWISIELPSKIKLDRLKVIGSTRLSSGINQFPKDVVVAVSETGLSGSWSVLQTASLISQNVSNHSDTINITTQTSYYKYFALIVKSINSTATYSAVEIAGLELYGLPEYDSDAAGVDVKVTSYPNVPNTDWLEVYYDAKDLADGAVTSVDDLTPSGTNDGTATNVTVSDGAFVFNGTNSNVTTGTTLSDGAYPHSVSLWYYTNDDPSALADYLFQLGDNTENNSPSININGATFYLSFFGNYLYNTVASTGIQTKKWVQISYSYDGGPTTANNPVVYIDGKQITMYGPLGNSAGSALSLVLGTDPNVHLTIGSRRNGTLPVNGKIANFRLFNRAITSDEVWQLYSYQKEYFGHGDLSMTLKAGRLGIGTSEPRAALDVKGDIYGGCPVYFNVRCSTNAAAGIIPWDIITESKGGGFDNTTGTFTTPLTGVYSFSYSIRERDNNADIYTNVVINGVADSTLGRIYLRSNYAQSGITFLRFMNQGDTLAIQLNNGDMALNYNQFSGQYISSV